MEAAMPKYRAIASDLRERIVSGAIPIGGRLPTKAELMATHNVALNTVDRAIDILEGEGLVEAQQGVGTFVRSAEVGRKTSLEERVTYLEEQMVELSNRLDGQRATKN